MSASRTCFHYKLIAVALRRIIFVRVGDGDAVFINFAGFERGPFFGDPCAAFADAVFLICATATS